MFRFEQNVRVLFVRSLLNDIHIYKERNWGVSKKKSAFRALTHTHIHMSTEHKKWSVNRERGADKFSHFLNAYIPLTRCSNSVSIGVFRFYTEQWQKKEKNLIMDVQKKKNKTNIRKVGTKKNVVFCLHWCHKGFNEP